MIEGIMREYLTALRFVVADAGRDPEFGASHLLSYLGQDLIESAIAIMFLAKEGALRPAKREQICHRVFGQNLLHTAEELCLGRGR